MVNPGSHKGSPIEITQNGNLINTIPSGFSDHEFCLPSGFFDAETDVFEFKYTGGRRNDGVSFSKIFQKIPKFSEFHSIFRSALQVFS